MARPKRLELLTPRFVVWCSIQLSYGRNRGGDVADEVTARKVLTPAARRPPPYNRHPVTPRPRMLTNRTIDFRSDNVATVSPEILEALTRANAGPVASYGEDEYSHALNRQFSALFETAVRVFPVSTGTAANALALAACARPYGGIFCHDQAHIHTSEGAATEMFTHGAKLVTLPGDGTRLIPAELDAAIARAGYGQRHKPQPDAISVTQATEGGTVYSLDDLDAIGAIARARKLVLHMDGARFANALATLGCTAARMTTRVGVDILSFGATKNGCMNTEAIVVFNPALVEELAFRLRRAGQTWSKMRFAAVQLSAYVQDDLYLRSARRANQLARRLEQGLSGIPGIRILAPVGADIVFAELPEAVITALQDEGFLFYRRSPTLVRLVTHFDGADDDVTLFLDAVARLAARQQG